MKMKTLQRAHIGTCTHTELVVSCFYQEPWYLRNGYRPGRFSLKLERLPVNRWPIQISFRLIGDRSRPVTVCSSADLERLPVAPLLISTSYRLLACRLEPVIVSSVNQSDRLAVSYDFREAGYRHRCIPSPEWRNHRWKQATVISITNDRL